MWIKLMQFTLWEGTSFFVKIVFEINIGVFWRNISLDMNRRELILINNCIITIKLYLPVSFAHSKWNNVKKVCRILNGRSLKNFNFLSSPLWQPRDLFMKWTFIISLHLYSKTKCLWNVSFRQTSVSLTEFQGIIKVFDLVSYSRWFKVNDSLILLKFNQKYTRYLIGYSFTNEFTF